MADTKSEAAPMGAAEQERVTLGGVSYALLGSGADQWRMGSTNPLWQQSLPGVSDPGEAELAALAEKGIWLGKASAKPPKLAVMCCGQGVVWPGMGRELYDNFPAARAAMDRIAGFANWDVLAMLDEPSVETIGLTRWQQPYLFLLEYAQWSLYRAMGLEPDMICGHSLGELIALCFAGVYDPEVCWYIMDTRSRHITDLENKASRDLGMMAVYAGEDVIAETLAKWPDIFVSNYNTPNQSILSGPRDSLMQARRALRKGRHPALMLNVTMAFHNPAMRVLRDLSYTRLNALDMRPWSVPMLSCVTTGLYPTGRTDITNAILDLDENTVHWVGSVRNLWQTHGIRHFLETGPQDTLCGLVGEIQPGALCMSSSSRGHETEMVRRTLARLHALGHLPISRVRQAAEAWPFPEDAGTAAAPDGQAAREPSAPDAAAPAGAGGTLEVVRGLLAEACGREPAAIRAGMDLRFDLAMRSSSFPRLIEKAQERLGITVAFEDLIQVATVGDLVRTLGRLRGETAVEDAPERIPLGAYVRRPYLVRTGAPAGALGAAGDGPLPGELSLDPTRRLFIPGSGSVIAVYGIEDALAAELIAGIAPLAPTFLVGGPSPDGYERLRRVAAYGGARVLDLCIPGSPPERALSESARVDALLLAGGMARALDAEQAAALCRGLLRVQCRLLVVVHVQAPATADAMARTLEDALRAAGVRMLEIVVDLEGAAPAPTELGDFLAREMACGATTPVRWVDSARARPSERPLLDNADNSPLVFPAGDARVPRHSLVLVTGAQFSMDRDRSLADAMPAPRGDPALDFPGARRLPLADIVGAKLQSACMLLPWLTPAAVSDLHLPGGVGLVPGVTREVKIVTSGRQWMLHEDLPVRMCYSEMAVRTLHPSGRRADRYAPVSNALVIMGSGPCPLAPFWELPAEAGEPRDAEDWYASAGIGPSLRLLADVAVLPGGALRASLRPRANVAPDGVWKYTATLSAVEGAVQAARMAFTLAPSAHPGPFALALVGYIRMGTGDWRSPCTLLIRRCWDSPAVVRYDAQVTDAFGQCLLAINHLEFDRVAPPADGERG